MEIHGASAFLHFLRNSGLTNIDGQATALMVCMDEFDRLCACDTIEYKAAKINNCRAIYQNFISGADRFKHEFLSKSGNSKITFYSDDGKHLKTFSR
jgi:hypothetical protein